MPSEATGERLDRELGELLQELRVMLPGVQVLFAFLLGVPFTQRFPQLEAPEKALYLATLVLTALATAFLVSPSAFHRVLFREHDKEWIIKVANKLAVTGTICLATAISSAVFLVTEMLYGSKLASIVTAVLGFVFLLIWYAVPLIRRATNPPS